MEHVELSQWLNKKHWSKSIGLKGGALDIGYAHLMSTHYLAQFVGKDKTVMSITTTIKILESYDVWQGGGLGDGSKEHLEDTLQIALRHHEQYCKDHLPDEEVRTMALKTAEATCVFWSALVAYINNEYAMLNSFKLQSKHIMLLLLNQIVQICDEVFEARGNATSVDLKNKGAAAARYAWVTLQSLHCMTEYSQDKFKYHQAINSTFVRFLTHHMADKSAIGLKLTCDTLQSKVKVLETKSTKKVTLNIYNKLDSKVSNLLCLNPLLNI